MATSDGRRRRRRRRRQRWRRRHGRRRKRLRRQHRPALESPPRHPPRARAGRRARAGEGGAVARASGGQRWCAVRALCARAGLCGRRVGRGAAGARTLRGPRGLSRPAPPKVPRGGLEPTLRADRASGVRGAALSRAAPSRSLQAHAVAERAPCREPSGGVERPWGELAARASKSRCAPSDLRTRGSAPRSAQGYAKCHGGCSNRNELHACVPRHSRQSHRTQSTKLMVPLQRSLDGTL